MYKIEFKLRLPKYFYLWQRFLVNKRKYFRGKQNIIVIVYYIVAILSSLTLNVLPGSLSHCRFKHNNSDISYCISDTIIQGRPWWLICSGCGSKRRGSGSGFESRPSWMLVSEVVHVYSVPNCSSHSIILRIFFCLPWLYRKRSKSVFSHHVPSSIS